jgi:hypothetical protein
MYDCTGSLGVDPRSIAQRIMEIRTQIAKEMIQELQAVSEENSLLMRETLTSSLSLDNVAVAEPGAGGVVHPDFQMDQPDNSAGGGDD